MASISPLQRVVAIASRYTGRRTGHRETVITLYQAEWCPHSHRIRQRLTELGLDFVARQVQVDPDDRTELADATGQRSIPALVLDDGTVLSGEEEILPALDERFTEPAEAERHRAKAVEEWPDWLRLAAP
jgi:glutathione S-transferase